VLGGLCLLCGLSLLGRLGGLGGLCLLCGLSLLGRLGGLGGLCLLGAAEPGPQRACRGPASPPLSRRSRDAWTAALAARAGAPAGAACLPLLVWPVLVWPVLVWRVSPAEALVPARVPDCSACSSSEPAG
jgi:hypothetical protein